MKKAVCKTQKQMVQGWLEKGWSITSLQAIDKFGITRLSAVIFELRKFMNIVGKTVKVKNRFGRDCWVEKYSLGE